MIDCCKQKCFQLLFKKFRVVVSLMTGNLFHAFGPATEKRSFSIDQSCSLTNKSCFATERSFARPGMSTTEVTSSVKYDGDRPLMAWCTEIQSLKFIRSEICSQCRSYRTGDTCSRGFKSITNRAAALRTLWSGANVEAGKLTRRELQFIIQPWDVKGGYQSRGHVSSKMASYRAQTTKMVRRSRTGQVEPHMSIEVDTQVPNQIDWLNYALSKTHEHYNGGEYVITRIEVKFQIACLWKLFRQLFNFVS